MSLGPTMFAFCLTYGRPQCVANIIEQWEQMIYDGKRHLVIVDDGGQYPNEQAGECWEIVSIKKRMASLGEKANFACGLSRPEDDILVVVEDDDYLAPGTLEAHADAFKHGEVSIPKWFYMQRGPENIRLHSNNKQTNAHASWAFSRDVFRRVKGYPWIDIGHENGMLSEFINQRMTFCNPTANFIPYFVSRNLVNKTSHLSRNTSKDPWAAMERDLPQVLELPEPDDQNAIAEMGIAQTTEEFQLLVKRWWENRC